MPYCGYCGGKGKLEGDYLPCYSCNGRGDNGMDRRIPCNTCRGSGKADTRRTDICWNCGGSGLVADPPSKPPPKTKPSGSKPGSKPAPGGKDNSGTLDGIGKLMAAVAALIAWVWAHETIPDTPVSWFIFAGLAAMLTYAARKLIVFLAGVAGALMLFANRDDAEQKVNAPTTSETVTATPTVTARPATTSAKVRMFGFCVVNDLSERAYYTLALPGRQQSERQLIEPGHIRHGWESEAAFQRPPTMVQMHLEGAVDRYDLPLGSYDAARFDASDRPICGDGGLPVYSIRAGEFGLQVWVR